MGYRLNVKQKRSVELTKLYGYVDMEELASYKYLVALGKFDGTEVFSYGCKNKIALTWDEFCEFIEKYKAEYIKFCYENYVNPKMNMSSFEASLTKLKKEDGNVVLWWE